METQQKPVDVIHTEVFNLFLKQLPFLRPVRPAGNKRLENMFPLPGSRDLGYGSWLVSYDFDQQCYTSIFTRPHTCPRIDLRYNLTTGSYTKMDFYYPPEPSFRF